MRHRKAGVSGVIGLFKAITDVVHAAPKMVERDDRTAFSTSSQRLNSMKERQPAGLLLFRLVVFFRLSIHLGAAPIGDPRRVVACGKT